MEKLGKRQAKDHIADALRNDILSGRIEDGEEFTQERLAEILEVSRMPVREALQLLEVEGLMLRLPNRHMRVVGPNEKTVYEIMRVVAAVESEIALILMDRGLSPEESEMWDSRKFHNWFSRRLESPYLYQVHRRLLAAYPQYVWEMCKEDGGRFAELDRKIYSALESGNAGAVRSSIMEYYCELACILMSRLRKGTP